MTTLAMTEPFGTHTSAAGSMFPPGSGREPIIFRCFAGLSASPTGSTYARDVQSDCTAVSLADRVELVPLQTIGEAILEIRRRAGLTWEELGDLFNVSRRSVHHWASGKAVSAKHDRVIHQTLAAIRRLDRGEAVRTRALLLSTDATGISPLDLLKDSLFEDAMARAERRPAPEPRRIPLSPEAYDMRKPPSPALFLEASQERPDIPAKARIARVARSPKATG